MIQLRRFADNIHISRALEIQPDDIPENFKVISNQNSDLLCPVHRNILAEIGDSYRREYTKTKFGEGST